MARWIANREVIERAALAFPTPTIAAVRNAADSHLETIQSDSWVSIYGANLAPNASGRTWGGHDIINGELPLSLDGVRVTINGKPAFVEYVSPTQLNVLAPSDATTGPVNVVVSNENATSSAFSTDLQTYAPTFFALSPPNQRYIAATVTLEPEGQIVYLAPNGALGPGVACRPARAGDVLELYGTGFGQTNPTVPPWLLFFGAYPTQSPVTITIGGINAAVYWAGQTSPGLYQLNVGVPPGLTDGDAAVVATVGGVRTQDGLAIPIQQ
jgi:uncharacterized protein (TIGR03437 family)